MKEEHTFLGRRESMEKPTVLLPFVHGVDTDAIAYALNFTQDIGATLLLVCLVRQPEGDSRRKLRAETIAQTHDFFETADFKAARLGVETSRIQLSTTQVARSVKALAHEMACAGILLFVREGQGVLLETRDIKQLLEKPVLQPVYLFCLEAQKNPMLDSFKALGNQFQRLTERLRLLIAHVRPAHVR
jgi:hypothetical protein